MTVDEEEEEINQREGGRQRQQDREIREISRLNSDSVNHIYIDTE